MNMMTRANQSGKKIAVLVLFIVIFYPILLFSVINEFFPQNSSFHFYQGWEDKQFITSGEKKTWTLDYYNPLPNPPIFYPNILSVENTLVVTANGVVPKDAMVTAQRQVDLDFDLQKYNYLNVSILTSSLNVATRIVIWTSPSDDRTVLLKTYNDRDWHIEIINLNYFGINTNKLFMIELSWLQLSEESNSSVLYRNLSLNRLG